MSEIVIDDPFELIQLSRHLKLKNKEDIFKYAFKRLNDMSVEEFIKELSIKYSKKISLKMANSRKIQLFPKWKQLPTTVGALQ
jgi:hypothetical protein